MQLYRRLPLPVRAFLPALAVVLCGAASAWACPSCKESLSNDPAAAGIGRGIAISIIFMLSMPFLIFGGLSSYFYWEVCRARKRNAEAAKLAEQSAVSPE